MIRNISTGPVTALTMAPANAVVADAATRSVCEALMREALLVAISHGFDDLDIDPVADSQPGTRPAHKPSMLQDIERGRPLEIDTMIAAVADFARQFEIATPTIDTVLALLVLRARTAGLYGTP